MENTSLPQNPLSEESFGRKGMEPADQNLAWLYRMLAAVFAGLLLVNLGLWFLLNWQTRQVRAQLAQNQLAITRYRQTDEPMIKNVASKLEAFALQNRDYQAILQKYPGLFPRLKQTGSSPAAKPSGAPPAAPSNQPTPGAPAK